MKEPFQTGMETLLAQHPDWLRGARVGLVAHPASVNRGGAHSAELLHDHPAVELSALLGAEHGFWGRGGAGEELASDRHPEWALPVFSLYGASKRPTPAMLDAIDVVVFDLQNLAARCYTYLSTLRYLLEAAAEAGKTVVVADRPVPLPDLLDGPLLEPECESFVGAVPVPLQYGMTPGEAARWLVAARNLDVDLRVAPMRGYARDAVPGADWPPWVPPSPAIRSWTCALCYTATVFTEAVPALDCRRRETDAFQVLGASWLRGAAFRDMLESCRLPGVAFGTYENPDGEACGVRLNVTDPCAFRPVSTGVTMFCALQALYGDEIWAYPETREGFFDKLMGTPRVREQIREGRPAASILQSWQPGLRAFAEARAPHLLYPSA